MFGEQAEQQLVKKQLPHLNKRRIVIVSGIVEGAWHRALYH